MSHEVLNLEARNKAVTSTSSALISHRKDVYLLSAHRSVPQVFILDL